MKSNHLKRAGAFVSACLATSSVHAAFITLNSPTVGPNQPGTFYVTGTITVGAGESVLSPTLVSTVAVPFLPSLTAGFNSASGNFNSSLLAWNGLSTYTGNILDFTVNPGNLGYSGGMPLGVYNTNPLFPGGPGISLDYLDAAGVEHSMNGNYHITVASTPEPASLIVLSFGALALRKRRRLQEGS